MVQYRHDGADHFKKRGKTCKAERAGKDFNQTNSMTHNSSSIRVMVTERSRSMETRDHKLLNAAKARLLSVTKVKNGASLKSQMSREKFRGTQIFSKLCKAVAMIAFTVTVYTGAARAQTDITSDGINLEQLFTEALEKLTPFEELCSELMKLDGIVIFYEEENPKLLKKYGAAHKDIVEIAKQKFSEVTGGFTYEAVDEEIDKRLPPGTKGFMGNQMRNHPGAFGGTRAKINTPKNLKIFTESIKKDVAELTPILESMAIEIEQSAVMLIPPDYRYSFAIETMLRFIKNRRASTWKECANLYEEQLHRWAMEANNAQYRQIQYNANSIEKQSVNSDVIVKIFKGYISFVKLINSEVNRAGEGMFR